MSRHGYMLSYHRPLGGCEMPNFHHNAIYKRCAIVILKHCKEKKNLDKEFFDQRFDFCFRTCLSPEVPIIAT